MITVVNSVNTDMSFVGNVVNTCGYIPIDISTKKAHKVMVIVGGLSTNIVIINNFLHKMSRKYNRILYVLDDCEKFYMFDIKTIVDNINRSNHNIEIDSIIILTTTDEMRYVCSSLDIRVNPQLDSYITVCDDKLCINIRTEDKPSIVGYTRHNNKVFHEIYEF